MQRIIFAILAVLMVSVSVVPISAQDSCEGISEYLDVIREIRREYADNLDQEFDDPLHEGAWRYFALIQFRDSLYQVVPSTIPECAFRYHGLLIGWTLVKSDWTYYMMLNLAAGENRFLETVNIYTENERRTLIALGEEYKRFGQ